MKKISLQIQKIEQTFIGILLLLTVFVLFINVVLRYVFNANLTWVEEFARYAIVWVSFIGASVCIYKGSHITVDAILVILSDKNKKYLSVIVNVIAILFSALLLIYTTNLTIRVVLTNQKSATLGISMLYIYGAMPIGCLLWVIRYTEQLIQSLKQISR